MHSMNNLALIFLLALGLGGCTGRQTQQESSRLSATDFSEKISETENALILDVRTPEEFEKGHLENAVNIDWKGSDFDRNVSKFEPSTPVFVYCLSGGRSKAAADHLKEIGFENITELAGGMMEWRANNLPETAPVTTENGMSFAQYQTLLNSDKLVLVDFYADWCEPCKKMEPYLKKIANEMADKVTLVRIDADENQQLCKTLDVSALPVLKLYENQEITWEHEGYIDEQGVRNHIP
ncbi:thioredoxin [Parapedobacter indicus]|uniref:Thioredoxin n=2 Tax=Parapedobacter indicus TaxID=1477437 RepID=A0A1I3LW03_9SPHI|nr:thioredoxin [Parapedobacter indicus]SFI88948.1 thioredoxin [Parapedobacter indicus]